MWPGRVSNPGPLTYESGALPIALRGPAHIDIEGKCEWVTRPPPPPAPLFLRLCNNNNNNNKKKKKKKKRERERERERERGERERERVTYVKIFVSSPLFVGGLFVEQFCQYS